MVGGCGEGSSRDFQLTFISMNNLTTQTKESLWAFYPLLNISIPVSYSASWLLLCPRWLYDYCTHFALDVAEHYHLVSISLGPPLLSVSQFCSSISFCQPWPGEDDHPWSWCRARNRTWESDLCLLNYYLLKFADASLCPICVGYCSEKTTTCPKGRVWNINPQLFHKKNPTETHMWGPNSEYKMQNWALRL